MAAGHTCRRTERERGGVCQVVGAACTHLHATHPQRSNKPRSWCLSCQSQRCLPCMHWWTTWGCVSPAEATGGSGCYHPAQPLVQLRSPKDRMKTPRPAAPTAPCCLASASRVAEHQRHPHQRARGASAGPETALSPHNPGVYLIRAANPAGCQPQGPLSIPSACNARVGEQEGILCSCLLQPGQGKAQGDGTSP